MAGGAVAGTVLAPGAAVAAAASGGNYPTKLPRGNGEKFYFIAADENGSYYIDVQAGLDAASDWFGVNASLAGTDNVDVADLVNVMYTVLARSDTRGMVIPVIDVNAYEPVFERAAARKVPVVTFNVDTTGPRAGFVGGSDPELIARATTLMGTKLGGKGKVAFISQIVTQQPLRERGVMFEADLKAQYPGISFVGSYNYDGTASGLLTTFDAVFTKTPDLAGLFIGDGSGGTGAQAIKAKAPNLALLLEDIVAPSRDAVKAGYAFACLGASVFDTAFACIQGLWQWNTGLRIPDTQYIAQTVITPANVTAFIANPYEHAAGATTTAS
jgi:ABC-type sugar transport system substrate-binding protein